MEKREQAEQVVFICGGRGRRFARDNPDLPKCMVECAGEPLLAHLARRFLGGAAPSAPPVFLVRTDDQTVADWARANVPGHVIVRQDRPDGVANAMVLAARHVPHRAIFILADLVLSGAFAAWPEEGSALPYWSEAGAADTSRNYGMLLRDGVVTSVIEKPADTAGLVCGMGVYLFTREVLEGFRTAPINPKSGEREITTAIAAAIEGGTRFAAPAFEGTYVNINTTEDLERASALLAGSR